MIGLYTASPVHKKITDAYTFNISAGLGLLQIYRHPTRHQKRKAENGRAIHQSIGPFDIFPQRRTQIIPDTGLVHHFPKITGISRQPYTQHAGTDTFGLCGIWTLMFPSVPLINK